MTPRPCDLFLDSNGVFSPKKVGFSKILEILELDEEDFYKMCILLNADNFNFFFKVETNELNRVMGTMEEVIKIIEGSDRGCGDMFIKQMKKLSMS